MSVAKGDGNHGEGRHRRVVLWGLEHGPERGDKSETGKRSAKNGEGIRIWGLKSDILMVNHQRICITYSKTSYSCGMI